MRLPYTPPASALWNPPHIATTLARRALRPSPSPSTSNTTSPPVSKPPALLPLDRALAHSPPLLAGWNALLGALRDESELDAVKFELACTRVAVLNGARFEWDQHSPLLRSALRERGGGKGDPERLVDAVRESPAGAFKGRVDGVEEADAAVLALVDEMTTNPAEGVSEGTWARVREVVTSERAVVELVASVAAYNMVSRFLTGLDVGEVGRWKRGERAKL